MKSYSGASSYGLDGDQVMLLDVVSENEGGDG
jgi:hypothetical protein